MHHTSVCFESLEYRMAPFAQVELRKKKGEVLYNPFEMSDDELRVLLEQIENNEILSLRFAARTFGDRPNANLRRPEPGQMSKLAKSAAGNPFAKDHDLSTDSMVGVIDRAVTRFADDGSEELFEVIELREKEAMIAFARRRMKEFSIQLGFESAFCSKCGTDAFVGWFAPMLACDCELGSTFRDPDTRKNRTVEVFLRGVSKMETSWVSIGAFRDTAVLAAFEAANQNRTAFYSINAGSFAGPTPKSEPMSGCGCGQTAAFGDSLASRLEDAIDGMTDEDTSRGDVLDAMAAAAGIGRSTVNQILNGSINCPPLDRLEGFAEALDGVSLDDLITAAESDGCSYRDADTSENTIEEVMSTKPNQESAADVALSAALERVQVLETELATLKNQHEALKETAFKMAFDEGVKAGKFSPTDERDQRILFEHRDKGSVDAFRAEVSDTAQKFDFEPKGAPAAPPKEPKTVDRSKASLALSAQFLNGKSEAEREAIIAKTSQLRFQD